MKPVSLALMILLLCTAVPVAALDLSATTCSTTDRARMDMIAASFFGTQDPPAGQAEEGQDAPRRSPGIFGTPGLGGAFRAHDDG